MTSDQIITRINALTAESDVLSERREQATSAEERYPLNVQLEAIDHEQDRLIKLLERA